MRRHKPLLREKIHRGTTMIPKRLRPHRSAREGSDRPKTGDKDIETTVPDPDAGTDEEVIHPPGGLGED